MSGVFVNYRAIDDPFGAAAIAEFLRRRFGPDNVFLDNLSMRPGENYPDELHAALERVDVLVTVIGPQWLTLTEEGTGRRLIERERDWVRMEIARSLERGIHVLPVLLKDTPGNAQAPRFQDLPEDIRGLATRQVFALSRLRLGEDLERLTSRLIELVPALVIPALFEPPPPPLDRDNAASTLLRASYGVVPFPDGDHGLADLHAWATGSAACSARLVIGPAGSGKTRLAMELCARLRAKDWLAGIVHGEAPAVQIGRTAAIAKPLLAVVDDIDLRADQLIVLAMAIGDRSALLDAPARLLLLGRSAGDWLKELTRHANPRVATLFQTITDRTTVTLAHHRSNHTQQFAAARRAFAARIGTAIGGTTTPTDLAGTTVLETHAEALDSLLRDTPSQADPFSRILRHDRRHLRRLLSAERRTDLDTAHLATICTVATLCRPASEEQALALRERLPEFLDGQDIAEHLAWLRRLYPGPYSLNPVSPDQLGEQLVATTLAACPDIAVTLGKVCTDEQVANALTVLGRALGRHPNLSDHIVALVRHDPAHAVGLGIDVAARLAEPERFVRALGTAIDDHQLPTDHVFALFQRLSTTGPALNPLKAVMMRVYTEVFAKPLGAYAMEPAVAATPGLAPLHRIATNLINVAQNAVAGFLDPGSGKMPKGPDIVPEPVLDVLRKIVVDRTWFPPTPER